MRKTIRHLLTLGVALTMALASGCTSVAEKARTMGAFQLNCPNAQTEVQNLGDDHFGVAGCGRRLVCWDVFFVRLQCEEPKVGMSPAPHPGDAAAP